MGEEIADGMEVVDIDFVNSGDPWVNRVFSIDLTLEEILGNLDERDLLNISLLNKYFAGKARRFLRENKKCVAIINGQSPCHVLQGFEATLKKSRNIPFNGLSVTTTEDSHSCLPCTEISDVFSILLTELNLKYLKVDWKWSLDTNCPAQQLLRMFLKERSSELKGLTIRELPWGEFSGTAFSQESPNALKNLNVLEFSTDVEIDWIEKIVPCAPNLKEIRGRVFPEHLKFLIPQKKLKLIKDFRFYPELSTTDLVAQYASENPRLDSMEISAEELRRDNASLETFKIILRILLEASSSSLKRLRLEEHLDILWFIYLPIPTLKNVQHLYLHFELYLDKHLGFCSLAKIDWNRLFPNLKAVEISLGVTPYQLLERYVDVDALRNASEHISTSVVELTLPDQGMYSEEFYGWLSKVFRALGGISPEEAEELRDEDSMFLENYQFVPVQPSILTMKNLKKLQISQQHHRDGYRDKNQKQLISEMSNHLVFSKMPKVAFELSKKECRSGQCSAV
ncbi:unnamed protein product [Allacma fusca]|uniref:F-box domain-containing protein n=1 Tax=Allacma fusca TaxID=39272 RepID=A0A8J2L4S0_9HEXA|nr:unnamed protein product [Allacma fusca]